MDARLSIKQKSVSPVVLKRKCRSRWLLGMQIFAAARAHSAPLRDKSPDDVLGRHARRPLRVQYRRPPLGVARAVRAGGLLALDA
ncbi:hypothetical protein NDU88_008115 [Pleurodeles waltl]|uniref:Uncharacterized protein n=1 Tax=Pleurodeles waltl TaxID=8319 RepID=A0AAV7SUR6_PLEWA|nr:hypothetical protein NDU88_008115 [Pleurodeles waltl]